VNCSYDLVNDASYFRHGRLIHLPADPQLVGNGFGKVTSFMDTSKNGASRAAPYHRRHTEEQVLQYVTWSQQCVKRVVPRAGRI
jgi:hypothetical protein